MTITNLPVSIRSLLYVSRLNMPSAGAAAEVQRIVAVARERNARVGITGSIVFTEVHFAQLLEGPAAAVDGLMEKIAADARHRDVAVVERTTVRKRRFPDWAMAYSGPSFLLDRHVKPLLSHQVNADENEPLVSRLMGLIEGLSTQST